MSFLVWTMVGIAVWHFTVFLRDRFWGGIVGAFLAAWIGGIASGYALPEPGLSTANPPGIGEAVWAVPGSVLALAVCYWYGVRREATWDDQAAGRA